MPKLLAMRAVLFDLDGTLTDSFSVWYEAVAELVRKYTGRCLSRPEYRRRWWGMDGRHKLAQLIVPDPEAVEALYQELIELLMRRVALIQPLPGAKELVEGLAGRVALAVISNGPLRFLQAQLAQIGLAGKFGAEIGDADPKPSPAGILRACQALAVPPQEALFVGDSRFDREAARAAGARHLIVPSSRDRLEILPYILRRLAAP
jgi:phosphoglycolate phosphatase